MHADSRELLAGSGQYGAVGFSYGGSGQASISDASSDSGSDFSDEEDEDEAGNDAVDSLAANLGIDNFSSMQRRAERLEEAERLGKVIKPKYVLPLHCPSLELRWYTRPGTRLILQLQPIKGLKDDPWTFHNLDNVASKASKTCH